MTDLYWISSAPTSVFHALCAISEGHALANPTLHAALAELAADLNGLLAGAERPADAVFSSLVRMPGILRLSDVKAMPASEDPCQKIQWPELRALGTRALNAFNGVQPRAADELALRVEPLREQWEARGPGLLHQAGKRTSPEWIVSKAEILLMVPVLGGGGRVIAKASPSIAIEAVLANPFNALPEVVRLGWLLAQLGVLRRSSQEFGPQQFALARVASLAWLPAVLAAAEDVELIRSAEAALPLAIEAWRLEPADPVVITEWWQRYQAERPAWESALAALQQRLEC